LECGGLTPPSRDGKRRCRIPRERGKVGSARRAKDERIGGFHPVASREAALAGAARLGVRRLDAALAQWEEGIA
jgi:hypothetical protein